MNEDSRFGAGSPEPPPLPRRSRWAWIVSTLAVLGAGLVLAFLLGIATSNPALYERHYIEFVYRLDINLLPRPMQIGIAGNPDWQLSVKRTQRIT